MTLIAIFIYFLSIVVSMTYYYNKNIDTLDLNGIINTITSPVSGADYSVLKKLIIYILAAVVICSIFVFFVNKNKNTKTKNITYVSVLAFLLIFTGLYFNKSFDAYNYVVLRFKKTAFFKDNYHKTNYKDVVGKDTNNLIYIYLESMENILVDEEESCVKELYELIDDNLNFSDNDSIGGAKMMYGDTITIDSMFSQSFGTPKLKAFGENFSYEGNANLISIGDILSHNNYIQEFMVGQDSNFANTKSLFEEHGYRIYDINDYDDTHITNANDRNKWGICDYLLFEQAKEEILKLYSEAKTLNKKFNFTMATIDCHYPEGYRCSKCLDEYENSYHNIYACETRNVIEFIDWLKQQEFYEDTTIILTGDHLNPNLIFELKSGSKFTVYNCFINSRIISDNTKNRNFSLIDMFPTTLAAMGFELNTNHLGFGTNLFSGEKTLMERYGVSYIKEELQKMPENPDFYR